MVIQTWRKISPLKVDFSKNFLSSADDLKQSLLEVLDQYLDEPAVQDVERALSFGEQAHEGQLRKSGEPYIYHPIAVAAILAEMRLDSRSIMAAILHDVIEDTPTAREHLEEEFGADIAYLVDGVSKISQIDFESPEAAEAENFRKMLLAMARDIRVILIKLADRLHNMRTLEALAAEKRQRIAIQTRDIYAPIAKRLGMHEWANELEDLSFKFIYPKRYNAIAKEINKRKGNRKSVVKKICAAIQTRFEEVKLDATVTGREKNIYSAYLKMRDRRQSLKQEVNDIFAIRVITQTADECYRALGIIHNLYKPIAGKFKDYIAIPKANGYQSLHTTVFGTFGQFIEVQIRTEAMHRIAEAGVASHWLYKTQDHEGVEPRQLARKWLVDLLENQQQAGNPSEFLEQLKVDLYPDQIYVFTPTGEIKKFPKGATTLDFAYAVHSDVGNRTVGAKVNGEQVPLHHVLQSGDHVEIEKTRTNQTTPSWLHFVVTAKARASIRAALKTQTDKDAIKLGKRLLERALKQLGHSTRIRSNHKLDLLRTFKRDDWNELLADIGFGRRLPMVVAQQLEPAVTKPKADEKADEPLAIEGVEGVLVNYGNCCRPVPGDNIIGFFASGKGIVIHTSNCPNYEKLNRDPERWVPVHWSAEANGKFPVNLRLEARNKRGVLANAARIVADHESNIVNVNVFERDSRHSSMDFTIEVRDLDHLNEIITALKEEEGLFDVQRKLG